METKEKPDEFFDSSLQPAWRRSVSSETTNKKSHFRANEEMTAFTDKLSRCQKD